MDISSPVPRAQACRPPVSLETVTLATGEMTDEAWRHSSFPAGRRRQQEVVLWVHDGVTTNLWGGKIRKAEIILMYDVAYNFACTFCT